MPVKKTMKNKKALTNRQYEKMLDDICSEHCTSGHYCILKHFLTSSHPDPRLLIQLKCVEKYRKQLDKEHSQEILWQSISWKDGWVKWIENGYAEKFAGIYEEGMPYTKIYKEVMKNG